MAARPYLTRGANAVRNTQPRTSGLPAPTPLERLDIEGYLAGTVTVKLGQLLGALHPDHVASVMRKMHHIQGVPTNEELMAIVEAAGLEIGAQRAVDNAPPQNIFAPFLAGGPDGSGVTHWANVDSGAMVNVVYSGVLAAHPELEAYRQEYANTVNGVGGAKTKVVGKLVGVPIALGEAQHASEFAPVPRPPVPTSFYVLDCPTKYHWILGLQYLNVVDGAVFTRRRQLHYYPPAVPRTHDPPTAPPTLPGPDLLVQQLRTRTQVVEEPVYVSFRAHVQGVHIRALRGY